MKELVEIQKELKAPKNQRNNFGNYNYRSCEDILEAVKPLANERGCVVLLSDEVKVISERVYVCSTAVLFKADQEQISVTAWAREPLTQKGMNEAQITGSASSYARKYALNGLFAIDDTKDADTNEHKEQENKALPNLTDVILQDVLKRGTVEELRALLNNFTVTKIQEKAIITRGKELQNGSK
jgi:hypothetical protein